jgi:hypothetical protein
MSAGSANLYGYELMAMCVADEFGNGVPVVFMLSSSSGAPEIELMMSAIHGAMDADEESLEGEGGRSCDAC